MICSHAINSRLHGPAGGQSPCPIRLHQEDGRPYIIPIYYA